MTSFLVSILHAPLAIIIHTACAIVQRAESWALHCTRDLIDEDKGKQ